MQEDYSLKKSEKRKLVLEKDIKKNDTRLLEEERKVSVNVNVPNALCKISIDLMEICYTDTIGWSKYSINLVYRISRYIWY